MMRTLWKGAISFGLVNVPIKLYTATEQKEIRFNYLHEKCKTPVKYEKRCPVCDVVVPPEEIVRGYEFQKGQYVVIKDEDLERIPDGNSRTIDIVDFVDLEEIDPIFFEKSYFLEPSQGGEKAYALLKRAMTDTGKIAVARVVIRTKEQLAVLRVYRDVLLMAIIFYPDEIRSTAGLSGIQTAPNLHENEIQMANSLIANLSGHFDPAKYTDTYRENLMTLIQTKITGGEVTAPEAKETGKVIDLMEALRASLAATTRQAEAPPGKSGTDPGNVRKQTRRPRTG